MPRIPNRQPVLKPQDFYLLLALAACRDRGTTYPELAAFSGLSMSEVLGALKRAEAARLLVFDERRPRILTPAFKEFLFHGARYAFPVLRGALVAGVPHTQRRPSTRISRRRPIRRRYGHLSRAARAAWH